MYAVDNVQCVLTDGDIHMLLLTYSGVLTDGDIHVLMENCWVTQWPDPQHNDEKQIVLVQQGCTRSPGTTWVRYEVSARDEETTPERLMIYRDLPHGSYVHCQLAMCYKGSSAPGQQVCMQMLVPSRFHSAFLSLSFSLSLSLSLCLSLCLSLSVCLSLSLSLSLSLYLEGLAFRIFLVENLIVMLSKND